MTAEVAILNRDSVALAADSASTLGDGADTKVHNTANKLFELSSHQPIAIMVYNGASFGPVSWETVIKEYRRKLARRQFDTVQEYALDFIGYLSSMVPYIPAAEQINNLRMSNLAFIRELDEFAQMTFSQIVTGDLEAEQADLPGHLSEFVAQRLADIANESFVTGITKRVAKRQVEKAISDWNSALKRRLPSFAIDASLIVIVRDYAIASARVAGSSPWYSGIVITGFGAKQMHPALEHYIVDGVVANIPRVRHVGAFEVAHDDPVFVSAFAQGDMVATFIDGIHPGHREQVADYVEEQLSSYSGFVLDQLTQLQGGPSLGPTISHARKLEQDLVKGVRGDLEEMIHRFGSGPVIEMVETLPKEMLGEMAEALVSLTSLKRRVTPGSETVGGPVDVAVISKGDGIIWLKRKYYFERELNVRYFNRI